MNSEQITLASSSPYVRNLTLAVIRSIRKKKLIKIREVVHSDLVPKFSEKVVNQQMREKIIPFRRQNFAPRVIPPKNTGMTPSIMAPPKMLSTIQVPVDDYGRINNLLNDNSVSSIECSGPAKKVMIMRYGQRQTTNIELSIKEIRDILDKIADKAHVPLLEGVFRAAVENFSINAVISEIVGTKFIIKKNTPYSLIDKS